MSAKGIPWAKKQKKICKQSWFWYMLTDERRKDMSKSTVFKAAFLPVNQAWVLVFGGPAISDLQIIDLDGQRHFDDLAALKWELGLKGLTLDSSKNVVSTDES